jgi:hypothetical protein
VIAAGASLSGVESGGSQVARGRFFASLLVMAVPEAMKQGFQEAGAPAGGVDEYPFCVFLLHPSSQFCSHTIRYINVSDTGMSRFIDRQKK